MNMCRKCGQETDGKYWSNGVLFKTWFDQLIKPCKKELKNTQGKIEELFENAPDVILTKVTELCNNFSGVLIEKNQRYGDSALNPANIFSPVGAADQICNRLDDKLNRIKTSRQNGQPLRKNDVCDVFGYLALLMIANGWTDFKDQID